MMMQENETLVNFLVDEERKQEWDEYVEKSDHVEYLSQLIRLAVHNEIHDDTDQDSGQATAEQFEEFSTQIENLKQRFDELDRRIHDIQEAVEEPTASPATEELANDVIDVLPTKTELQSEPVLEHDGPERGTTEWIATQLDAPEHRIRAAVDHAQETLPHTVKTDDSGRYYTDF